MEVSSEEDFIQKIKEVLPEINPDKKLTIMRDFINSPIFDYQILYNMLTNELNKTSAAAVLDSSSSDDHHHHLLRQEPNNKFSAVGVKLMPKPTLRLKFKLRPIPPLPTLSAPETNNVIKNRHPRGSKSDVGDDDEHGEIKAAAATLSNLDKNNVMKNRKPITGNPQKIAPKRQRIDLDGCYDLDKEEKDRAEKRNKKKTRSVVVGVSGAAAVNVAEAAADTMPPQELEEVMNRVQGCDPVLVIQKSLYKSDVNPVLARLSLPKSQVNPRFLTEKEEDKLLLKNDTIEADMYEPCGEQCVITLKKWNMTNSITYNLITTWKDIVRRNALEEKTLVQLWSFRVGGELCFFLAKL